MIITKAGVKQRVTVLDIHPLQSYTIADDIEWNNFSIKWSSINTSWRNIFGDLSSIDGSEFIKNVVIDPLLVEDNPNLKVRLSGIRFSSNTLLWGQANFDWGERQFAESFISSVSSSYTFYVGA